MHADTDAEDGRANTSEGVGILGNVSWKTSSQAQRETEKESIIRLAGTIIAEMKRCGRPNCRCSQGFSHGPYYYHYYRCGGRLRKRYVRPDNLEQVRAAIQARRKMELEWRVAECQLRQLMKHLKQTGLW